MRRATMATVGPMLLVTSPAVWAQGPCSIQGSWVSGFVDPAGVTGVESGTLLPVDPSRARLAYQGSITNPDVWAPFAPNAAVLGALIGTYVRTRPGIYRFTTIVHAAEARPTGTPGRGRVTSLAVLSGTAECIDESTFVQKGTFKIFSALDVPEMGIHNQDKDHDGFPDAGEAPVVSLPVQQVFRRVQVQEP